MPSDHSTPGKRSTDPVAPSTQHRPRRRRSKVVTLVAALLLAGGFGILGYLGYQLFGTDVVAQHKYRSERDQLRSHWKNTGDNGHTGRQAAPEPGRAPSSQHKKSGGSSQPVKPSESGKAAAAVPGDATGLLSIPAIGVDQVPVLEGTSQDVLSHGIGHYPKTVQAGHVGNFAVAGHRITHGAPFSRLLDVKKGDKVIMETRDAIYTYKIDTAPRKLTVEDTETWVLNPAPGNPQAQPHEPSITLTTCADLFHSPKRSVGFGQLVNIRHK